MNQPVYNEDELACAGSFLILLHNGMNPDRIMSLVMEFIAHNDGNRAEQRMAAINEANKSFPCPIQVSAVHVEDKTLFDELKKKVEADPHCVVVKPPSPPSSRN